MANAIYISDGGWTGEATLSAYLYMTSIIVSRTNSQPNIAFLPNSDMLSPPTYGSMDYPIEPPRAYFEVFLVLVFIPSEFGRFIVRGYMLEQQNPISDEPMNNTLRSCCRNRKKIHKRMLQKAPQSSTISCFEVLTT